VFGFGFYFEMRINFLAQIAEFSSSFSRAGQLLTGVDTFTTHAV
jgi:hypothetical protein